MTDVEIATELSKLASMVGEKPGWLGVADQMNRLATRLLTRPTQPTAADTTPPIGRKPPVCPELHAHARDGSVVVGITGPTGSDAGVNGLSPADADRFAAVLHAAAAAARHGVEQSSRLSSAEWRQWPTSQPCRPQAAT